ncbi:hypothetical protein TNCV_766421 [Trichonephila clavipes]|nr:hypothetical protein TNCV_766421 [Trichonephila clavipes]
MAVVDSSPDATEDPTSYFIVLGELGHGKTSSRPLMTIKCAKRENNLKMS